MSGPIRWRAFLAGPAAVGVNGQVPRANGDFAGRVPRGLPHASKVDSKH
jgi:hypothetical protein